jgi:hypothetical protein
MIDHLVNSLRRISGRMSILLISAGLTYLIYPQIASSAALWLQPSVSSTATALSAGESPEAFTELASLIGTRASENAVPVAVQVTTPAVSATPANQATAEYLDALATADALLKGTARPTPLSSGTATPIRPTPTSTVTTIPTSIAIVIVTETPTPLNIITVAAQAAAATAVATTIGTYTPVPYNWVVPVVVTSEPATAVPANAATATFQVAAATAEAFVYGTPTPTPINVWTATPTPFMRPVSGEVATPWMRPSPTPKPLPIPQELLGKIMFLSNRSGGPQPLSEPLVYVVDPDGSNLAVLTDYTFYNTALARDTFSTDQQYRAFVQEFETGPAIFYFDYHDNLVKPTTFFAEGQEAWDPVWSPTKEQIAFVSNANGEDEIWIALRDGSGLRQLTKPNETFNAQDVGKGAFTAEVNGRPSWSPDGSQIVFWSNRSGRLQIWVMDADGSNARLLRSSRYDDWNPVWIKHADPAREAVLGLGELQSSPE